MLSLAAQIEAAASQQQWQSPQMERRRARADTNYDSNRRGAETKKQKTLDKYRALFDGKALSIDALEGRTGFSRSFLFRKMNEYIRDGHVQQLPGGDHNNRSYRFNAAVSGRGAEAPEAKDDGCNASA